MPTQAVEGGTPRQGTEDIIAHYHLLDITTPDRYVYCKICQGMYGLLQAGIIAQELLAKRLNEQGYTQSKTKPGLWTHEWHPITFFLVIDNFGVKYIGEEHAQHLLQTVIRAHSKRKGKDIADSPSSGIMLARRCTFQCHHTLRRH
jgi:hypothetical protein